MITIMPEAAEIAEPRAVNFEKNKNQKHGKFKQIKIS